MALCPFCGANNDTFTKEWNYKNNYYNVKLCTCQKCKQLFMAYYHDGVFSHTIPKFVGAKKKILTYFKNHKLATEEELAKTLGLSARTVKKILLELEMEGIIEGLGNEL